MNQDGDIFDLQSQLCQSLGHAVRLRIVHLLKESPKPVGEIATSLGLSQAAVSRHLAVLRNTGILTAQRKAQEVYYEISNPKVVEVCEMMRSILTEREAQYLKLIRRD